MATTSPASEHLSGVIFSLLDTDLYKLTMQCAVLTYFSDIGETGVDSFAKLYRGKALMDFQR